MRPKRLERSAPTTASRWLGRIGALLIVAGLALGGYVAWQLWGTTWQSERRHASLVEEA